MRRNTGYLRGIKSARLQVMSEKVKFFMSFRARLMLLLSSFLVLTIVLVLALDKWAQKRASQEVAQQSEQVKNAVNGGFSDFAEELGMAIKNLNTERFMYEKIQAGEIQLPDTVEHIIVADEYGAVRDSTLEDL